MQTDYTAGLDFDVVRLCLASEGDAFNEGDAGTHCQTFPAQRGDHFGMGLRLASFPPVTARSTLTGTLLLEARLVDERQVAVRPGDGLATINLWRPMADAGVLDACTPREETCDLIDNDCDGACDEGEVAACFHSIRRFRYENNHIYVSPTEDPWDVLGLPPTAFVNEFFAFSVASEPHMGLVPLYRCQTPALTFLSNDIDCERSGGTASAPLGYITRGPVCGALPLVRYEHATTGSHLYLKEGSEVPANYVMGTAVGYVWP